MKEIIKKAIPEYLWKWLTYIYLLLIRSNECYDYRIKMKLFGRDYERLPEYCDEINYMKKKNKLVMFPYPFIEKYQNRKINVLFDPDLKLHYVIHQGKRLYYPSDMDEERIKNVYLSILVEQDEESPHCYFSKEYEFEENAVFMDVGCAEGNMALTVADKAKSLFLFEGEERWMPALKATFLPYADKVYINNKIVGDNVGKKETTIDAVMDEYRPEGNIYIKIDAEGSEKKIIRGAERTINTCNVKCACCTYHRQNDAAELKEFFQKKGFIYEFSKGYVLFKAQKRIKYPYFRKGLIRVKNY